MDLRVDGLDRQTVTKLGTGPTSCRSPDPGCDFDIAAVAELPLQLQDAFARHDHPAGTHGSNVNPT